MDSNMETKTQSTKDEEDDIKEVSSWTTGTIFLFNYRVYSGLC